MLRTVMFIKQLYQHSKTMFFCFLSFMILFVVINYKWGLVAMPVLQYGMYSGKHFLKDTLSFYTVSVNDKPLNSAVMSQGDIDNIQSYLDTYLLYQESNKVTYHSMRKYIAYVGLESFANHCKYNVVVSDASFYKWFRNKMEKVAGVPVHQLSANRQLLTWTGTTLQPAGPAFKIPLVADK